MFQSILNSFIYWFNKPQKQPKTLSEAIVCLATIINKEEKKLLLESLNKQEAAISLHSTLGRHIRNKWGLWHKSELALYLQDVYGIDHPDNMSHVIIMAYCRSITK